MMMLAIESGLRIGTVVPAPHECNRTCSGRLNELPQGTDADSACNIQHGPPWLACLKLVENIADSDSPGSFCHEIGVWTGGRIHPDQDSSHGVGLSEVLSYCSKIDLGGFGNLFDAVHGRPRYHGGLDEAHDPELLERMVSCQDCLEMLARGDGVSRS
jgi:hypothetical protein